MLKKIPFYCHILVADDFTVVSNGTEQTLLFFTKPLTCPKVERYIADLLRHFYDYIMIGSDINSPQNADISIVKRVSFFLKKTKIETLFASRMERACAEKDTLLRRHFGR